MFLSFFTDTNCYKHLITKYLHQIQKHNARKSAMLRFLMLLLQRLQTFVMYNNLVLLQSYSCEWRCRLLIRSHTWWEVEYLYLAINYLCFQFSFMAKTQHLNPLKLFPN